METYIRPRYFEPVTKDRVIQNGDSRDNKDIPSNTGVGHLSRFQRRILPYTYPEPVQEIHAFSDIKQRLPVQSTAIQPLHSASGVHCSGQRGQVYCTTKEYKDPPVPRRLVGQGQIPPACTDLGNSLSRARLVSEQRQIRTGTQTVFQLRQLSVLFERGQGQTHPRTLADPTNQNKSPPVCPVRKLMSLIGLLTATEKQVQRNKVVCT